MKIVIDYDLCEANAVCMDVCPEVFRVEEDDTLTVLIEKPPEKLRAKVEEAVRRSVRALLERRMELAERVIEGDDSIDRLEVEIEDECLKMLALHQPVASDLRFIVACLKGASDLERIGDLAGSIAERAVSFAARSKMPLPAQLHEMVEACARMLRSAIESFVRSSWISVFGSLLLTALVWALAMMQRGGA